MVKKIRMILLVLAILGVSAMTISANQFNNGKTARISFIQQPVTFLSNAMAKQYVQQKSANINSEVTPFIGRVGDIDNRNPYNFENPFTVKLLVAASILLSVGLTLFVGGLAGFIVGFFMEEIVKIIFLSVFGGACAIPGVVVACTSSVCFYKSWAFKQMGQNNGRRNETMNKYFFVILSILALFSLASCGTFSQSITREGMESKNYSYVYEISNCDLSTLKKMTNVGQITASATVVDFLNSLGKSNK